MFVKIQKFRSVLGIRRFCQRNIGKIKESKSKEQNAGIIGVNLRKICLFTYKSYAYHET